MTVQTYTCMSLAECALEGVGVPWGCAHLLGEWWAALCPLQVSLGAPPVWLACLCSVFHLPRPMGGNNF